jgi:EAL domain-containing protein (putative c-di-GMP-specific phosphodiesterase class I)
VRSSMRSCGTHIRSLKHRLIDRSCKASIAPSSKIASREGCTPAFEESSGRRVSDRVIIDVTESSLVPDGRALETLAVLNRLGATISIEDFGTGYSNLDTLGRLQPEIIKIDQSLLFRAGDTRGSSARILRAAVNLAHARDATVVVEGVADQQMWAQVCELDTDLAQGYFLAAPMPAR